MYIFKMPEKKRKVYNDLEKYNKRRERRKNGFIARYGKYLALVLAVLGTVASAALFASLPEVLVVQSKADGSTWGAIQKLPYMIIALILQGGIVYTSWKSEDNRFKWFLAAILIAVIHGGILAINMLYV